MGVYSAQTRTALENFTIAYREIKGGRTPNSVGVKMEFNLARKILLNEIPKLVWHNEIPRGVIAYAILTFIERPQKQDLDVLEGIIIEALANYYDASDSVRNSTQAQQSL
mgnify:CR=1 FL=1